MFVPTVQQHTFPPPLTHLSHEFDNSADGRAAAPLLLPLKVCPTLPPSLPPSFHSPDP